MPTTTVRAMTPADLAAVAALTAELGYSATVGDLAQRLPHLAPDGLFVAVVEERCAGWVHVLARHLLESEAHAELGGLVVGAAFRRHGVGRALVNQAIEWTRAHELSSLRLRSNVARTEAHHFYPALGFTLAKTSHTYTLRV